MEAVETGCVEVFPRLKQGAFSMIDRRDFLKTAAATAVLAMPAIRTAKAATAVTIFTPFGFGPDYIEVLNAKSAGYFEKQGLNATVRGAQGTAQVMQQLITGEAQIIRSAPIDQMRLVQKQGLPLISIATLHQASHFALVSHKDKPINDAKDLKGKTIGLVSVGGTTSVFLDTMLAKAGLKPEDVKRETTGNGPGAFELVKQGRVDAFIASHAAYVPLELAKEPITYFTTDKYCPMPNQVYMTTRDYAQKNPEVLVSFVKALKLSVDEIISQPTPPLFQRASKDFEIQGVRNMDAVVAMIKRWPPLVDSQGVENRLRNVPSLWKSGVDSLAEVGFLDQTDPGIFYTNEFVDKALKG